MKEQDLIHRFPYSARKEKPVFQDYSQADDPQENSKLMVIVAMVVSNFTGILIGMLLLGFIQWLKS